MEEKGFHTCDFHFLEKFSKNVPQTVISLQACLTAFH
jgi:hypothetical protein